MIIIIIIASHRLGDDSMYYRVRVIWDASRLSRVASGIVSRSVLDGD